jgi:hypothetical protein
VLRSQGKLTLGAWLEAMAQWGQQLWARLRSGGKMLERLLKGEREGSDKNTIKVKIPIPSAREEAYKAAEAIVKTTSKRQRPRGVTALVDKKTGKVYVGRSGKVKSPEELDPRVRDRLPSESQLPEGQDWPTYNCAEVDALNQAVKDGANPKDLVQHTVGIDKKTGKITDFERCANCKVTTKGIETTSDHRH